MADIFTEDELDRLAGEVERQLRALETAATGGTKALAADSGGGAVQPLQVIERATGEPARSFLAKFKAAAQDDICKPGGLLYEQHAKFKDIAAKDALKTIGPILAGLGLAAGPLSTGAVAVTVYLLHLGADAFCKGA